MPIVERVPIVPSAETRAVSRLHRHIFMLLNRCALGAHFRTGIAEEQPITLLPSEVEYDEGTIRIRIMTLARSRDILISAEARELVVEGRVQDAFTYRKQNATIYEKLQRRFTRSYELPWPIDPASVQASLNGCELSITASRAESGEREFSLFS